MRVAIAGLGNIGTAVVRLLQSNEDLIKNCGQEISVQAVSARDKTKKRDCDLSGIDWVDNPLDLARRSDVDVIIELIGGAEGVAHDLAKAGVENGKHLVTANKALLATYGLDLARRAEKAGVQLLFDAAVGGGIPMLKTLRNGLSANYISSVRGILNGTCNYILTRMLEAEMDFDAALAEAQAQGYAEADPSADIDGLDSAHKLALLSALAFATPPDLDSVFVEGIRAITLRDLKEAEARNGRIKLLGIAEQTPTGIVQRVQPVFVPLSENLGRLDGVLNGLEVKGDFVGDIFIAGQGAGGDATASSVVSDLIDIAYQRKNYPFGVSAIKLQ